MNRPKWHCIIYNKKYINLFAYSIRFLHRAFFYSLSFFLFYTYICCMKLNQTVHRLYWVYRIRVLATFLFFIFSFFFSLLNVLKSTHTDMCTYFFVFPFIFIFIFYIKYHQIIFFYESTISLLLTHIFIYNMNMRQSFYLFMLLYSAISFSTLKHILDMKWIQSIYLFIIIILCIYLFPYDKQI